MLIWKGVVLILLTLPISLQGQDFGPDELSDEARQLLQHPTLDADRRVGSEIAFVFGQLISPVAREVLGDDRTLMPFHQVRERSDRRYAGKPEWFYSEIRAHLNPKDRPQELSVHLELRVNGDSPEGAQAPAASTRYAYELNKLRTRPLGETTAWLLDANDGTDHIPEVVWLTDDDHLQVRVVDHQRTGDAWEYAQRVEASLREHGLVSMRARLLSWRRDAAPPPAAALQVRLQLLDEGGDADAQLTPADVADLEVVLRNTGAEELADLRVEVSIENAHCANESAVRLSAQGLPINCRVLLPDTVPLAKGQERSLSARVHTASEANAWIEKQLLRGLARPGAMDGDVKPEPELAAEIHELFRVKVSASRGGSSEVVFDEAVPLRWKHASRDVALSYPDLREQVGEPPSVSAAQLDYYRRGDVLGTTLADMAIRGVALRAARWGADGERAAAPRSGGWESAGPEFPEDPAQIVANVAAYVHAAMWPKAAPAELFYDSSHAAAFWNGTYGFGRDFNADGIKSSFVCQEHAQLFGSLLRVLGFPVRDMNIMQHPIFWGAYQDAASEVWVDGDWQWWGLFSNKIMRSHRAYAGTFTAYEVFEGSARFDETGSEEVTRFNLNSDQYLSETSWVDSGVWTYRGYADNERFTEAEAPPTGAKLAPLFTSWAVFEVFSPVSMLLELSDGRRVGLTPASRPHDPQPRPFLMGRPELGVVHEVDGAIVWPEGALLHRDATRPESAERMRQTVAIPAALADGVVVHLTGTGDGPYAVRRLDIAADGQWRESRGVKGIAKPGWTRAVNAEDWVLHASGTPETRPEDAILHAPEAPANVARADVVPPDVAPSEDPPSRDPRPIDDPRRLDWNGLSLRVPEGWYANGSTTADWLALRVSSRESSGRLVVRLTRTDRPDLGRAHASRLAILRGLGYGVLSRREDAARHDSVLSDRLDELRGDERRGAMARRSALSMDHQLGAAGMDALPVELPSHLRVLSLLAPGMIVEVEMRATSEQALADYEPVLSSLVLPGSSR